VSAVDRAWGAFNEGGGAGAPVAGRRAAP
jgi:hypothetical protein